ncbi:hypothetical protein DZD18_11235 [Rhodobacteraceae bacterium W635]|uniref:hypothetical protein n=1 Tax=Nioella halotolerans TaxID=2303578 RepID=UPI000E3EAF71|nr:hypothetical protein DZD18_11235 [Rhodobacteraceae bacterium W635]
MILSPDILISLSTLVMLFAIASALSAWSDGDFPTVALGALAAGVGVFVYGYWSLPDPQGWREVPDAFISVLSRVMAGL